MDLPGTCHCSQGFLLPPGVWPAWTEEGRGGGQAHAVSRVGRQAPGHRRVPRGLKGSTALKSFVACGCCLPLLHSEPLRMHMAAPSPPALRVRAVG